MKVAVSRDITKNTVSLVKLVPLNDSLSRA